MKRTKRRQTKAKKKTRRKSCALTDESRRFRKITRYLRTGKHHEASWLATHFPKTLKK